MKTFSEKKIKRGVREGREREIIREVREKGERRERREIIIYTQIVKLGKIDREKEWIIEVKRERKDRERSVLRNGKECRK